MEDKKIIEPPKIKDYTMTLHLSMSKKHLSIHQGTIVWEGNPCDGKTVIVETHTPKSKNGNFRQADTSVYLKEKDSPMFKSMKEFYNHYNNQSK